MITPEEQEEIKEHLKGILSEQKQDEFNAISVIEGDYEIIHNILEDLDILKISHVLYHTVENLTESCKIACNSTVVKLFIEGYNCRKAMEERKELARLVSSTNS